MEFLILLAALILLNVAAWLKGVDSTDAIDSEEWERRRAWHG